MQDWDTRIETLKSNIENARKRWVVPNLESQKKAYDEKNEKIKEETKEGIKEEVKVEAKEETKEDVKEEVKVEAKEETKEDVKEEKKKSSKGRKKAKEEKPDLIAIELAELEKIDEENLSEEQEDRLMELRRIRAQRRMHQEIDEDFQTEMKKADEEIKSLKSELNIKDKLPKGYVE